MFCNFMCRNAIYAHRPSGWTVEAVGVDVVGVICFLWMAVVTVWCLLRAYEVMASIPVGRQTCDTVSVGGYNSGDRSPVRIVPVDG